MSRIVSGSKGFYKCSHMYSCESIMNKCINYSTENQGKRKLFFSTQVQNNLYYIASRLP